jgi:hypothetical protein
MDVLCDLVSALQAQNKMEDAEVVYMTAVEVGGLTDMGRYRLQAFLRPQNRMGELQQLFAMAQHGGRESGRGGRLLEPMAESMLAATPYGRQHALQSADGALEELRAVWGPGHVQVRDLCCIVPLVLSQRGGVILVSHQSDVPA